MPSSDTIILYPRSRRFSYKNIHMAQEERFAAMPISCPLQDGSFDLDLLLWLSQPW